MSGPVILLIVLGVILGPAYYGYCEYVSGEELQSITVTERSERWTLPDGTIQRFRSGLAYRPVELTLQPELNRLRLGLTFEFPAEGQSPPVEYLATLLDQDYPVAAGNYLLLLEEIGPPRPAASVTVHLRGKIEQLYPPLMWLGHGLLLVGLGLLAFSLARGVPRRR
jgi:hypothetical protein